MKLSIPEIKDMKALLLFIIGLCCFCFLFTSSITAADKKAPDTTDLSNMDWSDAPEETDLSQESWADETESDKSGGTLSEMSWEDEEGENGESGMAGAQTDMSREESMALDVKERRIHFLGFLMFIGYIAGGVLTGYFTRNRKVAVVYPPELLILLHTVWPIEWVFMLFAGKKVR